MTDPQEIPETPSELAKRLWDTALEHLEAATKATDVPISDSYVRIGELALAAAQFALNNQALLAGVDPENVREYLGLPPGAPPLPDYMSGPVGGPKVWGGK